MHELAIADSIVAVASRHAAGRRVLEVEVRVGHLRQVVPDALAFAFQLTAEGTCVAGAELRLTEVPVAGRCRTCGAEGEHDDFPFACRACGSLDQELTAGEELLVDSLVLDDALTTIGGKGDGD